MMWKPDWRRIAGLRTAIYESRDRARPVVLLHGSSLAVDGPLTWFRTVPALSGLRVIAYDQPGFGASAMLPDGQYRDREARAQHGLALLDELALRDAVLIGHSEGGYIAARMALLRPDRVARLAICASGGTAPALGGTADAAWMEAAAQAYDYLGRGRDEDTFVATEARLQARADPEFEARLRANYRTAERSGNLAMFRRLASSRANQSDYTRLQEQLVLAQAERLRQPVLLVWGGADATVPVARGQALADRLPDARLEVLEGAGHWLMHDRPDDFNRLLTGWCNV